MTEELIGFFVNTIVIPQHLDYKKSFESNLRTFGTTVVGCLSEADTPFEQVVNAVQPIRDTSRNPLFQVMFVLQNGNESEPSSDSSPRSTFKTTTTKFELTLFTSLVPSKTTSSQQDLQILLEFNSDVFNENTAIRILNSFKKTLQTSVDDLISSPLHDINISSDDCSNSISIWNDTTIQIPIIHRDSSSTLHGLFESSVERNGNAICCEFDSNSVVTYTYDEINIKANQLSQWLLQNGAGPEISIVIMFERSLEMIVSQLAVLKTGGNFVPIDPSYPTERISFIIADCSAPMVLSSSNLSFNPPSCCDYISLNVDVALREDGILSAFNDANPNISVSSSNLAYIIYTSGSTGMFYVFNFIEGKKNI